VQLPIHYIVIGLNRKLLTLNTKKNAKFQINDELMIDYIADPHELKLMAIYLFQIAMMQR